MPEYITAEGMNKLQRRVNRLLEERPAVVQQVVKARELGDLSENAEYHAAKEKQRQIDHDLTYLRGRIARLKVLDTSTLPKDAIRFGAYVRAREIKYDTEYYFRLVGVDEADEKATNPVLVSVASPIGKAMIGKKPGDQFTVKAPIGDRIFEVLEIS